MHNVTGYEEMKILFDSLGKVRDDVVKLKLYSQNRGRPDARSKYMIPLKEYLRNPENQLWFIFTDATIDALTNQYHLGAAEGPKEIYINKDVDAWFKHLLTLADDKYTFDNRVDEEGFLDLEQYERAPGTIKQKYASKQIGEDVPKRLKQILTEWGINQDIIKSRVKNAKAHVEQLNDTIGKDVVSKVKASRISLVPYELQRRIPNLREPFVVPDKFSKSELKDFVELPKPEELVSIVWTELEKKGLPEATISRATR